jgi:hypothetical protein
LVLWTGLRAVGWARGGARLWCVDKGYPHSAFHLVFAAVAFRLRDNVRWVPDTCAGYHSEPGSSADCLVLHPLLLAVEV